MRKFGLIGKKLGHSFSKKYFKEKFAREQITDASYELYELAEIGVLKELLVREPELVGLNVTVPYKEQVLPLLNELDPDAARIGAVNTLKITRGRIKGYNTDYSGFKSTLQEFYPVAQHGRALVFGTGGAAKAVWAALESLGIPYTSVSRQPGAQELAYEALTPALLQEYPLLINTTPLGMHPQVDACPPLPYNSLTSSHYAYDLVYNPEQTLFLQKCAAAGAKTKNGLEMLYRQAAAAWHVWTNQV